MQALEILELEDALCSKDYDEGALGEDACDLPWLKTLQTDGADGAVSDVQLLGDGRVRAVCSAAGLGRQGVVSRQEDCPPLLFFNFHSSPCY